jgi:hypothetical protein
MNTLFLFLLFVIAQIVVYFVLVTRAKKESYFPASEAVLVPGKGADTTVVRCDIRPGEVYAIRDPLEEQDMVEQQSQHHPNYL